MPNEYTPGPWEVKSYVIKGADGWYDYGNNEANAHLIAASPIMFNYILQKAYAGDNDARSIVGGIDMATHSISPQRNGWLGRSVCAKCGALVEPNPINDDLLEALENVLELASPFFTDDVQTLAFTEAKKATAKARGELLEATEEGK